MTGKYDKGVTIDGRLPSGFSGSPVFHLKSGKVIGTVTVSGQVNNPPDFWTGPGREPFIANESVQAAGLKDLLEQELRKNQDPVDIGECLTTLTK